MPFLTNLCVKFLFHHIDYTKIFTFFRRRNYKKEGNGGQRLNWSNRIQKRQKEKNKEGGSFKLIVWCGGGGSLGQQVE